MSHDRVKGVDLKGVIKTCVETVLDEKLLKTGYVDYTIVEEKKHN